MFENFASNIGQGLKVSIVGLIVVVGGLLLPAGKQKKNDGGHPEKDVASAFLR